LPILVFDHSVFIPIYYNLTQDGFSQFHRKLLENWPIIFFELFDKIVRIKIIIAWNIPCSFSPLLCRVWKYIVSLIHHKLRYACAYYTYPSKFECRRLILSYHYAECEKYSDPVIGCGVSWLPHGTHPPTVLTRGIIFPTLRHDAFWVDYIVFLLCTCSCIT